MENTIIKASAGSGKTFRLSNRYLGLLLADQPVETILASTFTRKAAGEILDRILRELAHAATDPKKRRALAEHVPFPGTTPSSGRPDPGGDSPPSDIVDDAQAEAALLELLGRLAKNFHRLRISTLDSFFNKIAGSFSLELGLPPGWTMIEESDSDRYLLEAVRTVLSESHRNGARELMFLLQQGEQDRNVTRELVDLAGDLLAIVHRSSPEVWDHEELRRRYPVADDNGVELNRRIEVFAASSTPKKKDGTEYADFIRARENIPLLADREAWSEMLKTGLVKNILQGKPKLGHGVIQDDMRQAVTDLLDFARADIFNKLVARTKAMRSLLDLIDEAYRRIQFRERGYRFEDITERLDRIDFSPRKGTSGDYDISSLSKSADLRLDARTKHLLLDEFQDTSIPQWNVMRSFARNATEVFGGSFFCVGDVKQAIYAWRGGVAGIFDTLPNDIPRLRSRSLNHCFRCSPAVIETVNALFGSIDRNSALKESLDENDPETPPIQEAASKWQERFETHFPAEKTKGLPGRCVLEVGAETTKSREDQETGSDDDPADNDSPFFRDTLRRIIELREKYPGAEIGVLVMRNRQIGALIAGLKRLGIEASEEGGNPLTDSAAVQHVLSAMKLADHPGDRIARFHLAHGPLAESLGLACYREIGQTDDRPAVKCSLRLRRELVRDGYGIVVQRLVETLADACNPREFQRLEKLLEMAHRFGETDRGVRTNRFIEMVETTKVESPSAAPIRIMTIHKAKGLEFDIVVLPDLDGKLVKKEPRVIVDRETPTSPVRSVIQYVRKDVQRLLPGHVLEAFQSRVRGEVEESLSLLYVAMTRAVYELIMIVPPLSQSRQEKMDKGKAAFMTRFSGVLRAGLISTEKNENPNILFECRTANWSEKAVAEATDSRIKEQTKPKPERIDHSLVSPSTGRRRNLVRVAPSSLEREFDAGETVVFTGSVSGAKQIDRSGTRLLDRNEARLWGTAVHACFETGLRDNPWLDESQPDRTFLVDIVRPILGNRKTSFRADDVVESFLEICRKPIVRQTHSLANYPSSDDLRWDVEHERRFAVRLDDRRLLHGSIDRLVIGRKNGRAVALEVIDYKTDRFTEEPDFETRFRRRVATYVPQLEAYRDGVSRLFRIDSSKVAAKLLFVEVDRCVALD